MLLEITDGEKIGIRTVARTKNGLFVMRIWNRSLDMTNEVAEHLGFFHNKEGIYIEADTAEMATCLLIDRLHERVARNADIEPIAPMRGAVLQENKNFDVLEDEAYLTLVLFPTKNDISCVRILAKEDSCFFAVVYANEKGMILELSKDHSERVLREGCALIIELDPQTGDAVGYEARVQSVRTA